MFWTQGLAASSSGKTPSRWMPISEIWRVSGERGGFRRHSLTESDPLPNESELTHRHALLYIPQCGYPASAAVQIPFYFTSSLYIINTISRLAILTTQGHEHKIPRVRRFTTFIMSILSISPRNSQTDAPRDRNIVVPASGKSSTPFPMQAHQDGEESSEVWDMQPEAEALRAQRTVRRKKSSFDLRDVFKNGGVVPTPSLVSML